VTSGYGGSSVAFYAVNFTARLESTNLLQEELVKFSRIVKGKVVVLCLTAGRAQYSESPPNLLNTGEQTVQLWYGVLPPNSLVEEDNVAAYKSIASYCSGGGI